MKVDWLEWIRFQTRYLLVPVLLVRSTVQCHVRSPYFHSVCICRNTGEMDALAAIDLGDETVVLLGVDDVLAVIIVSKMNAFESCRLGPVRR